jgi:hypothetical protein
MKRSPAILLTILAVTCQSFIARSAFGQEAQQRTQAAPTGLALEITYYEGRAPAYLTVTSPKDKHGSAWYAMFGQLPGWRPPAADALPVKAVNILTRQDGDLLVQVIVSVHLGSKFFEKEEPIATYNLRENEAVSVNELTGFGVVPFKIKVVRVNPIIAGLPSVLNKTDSLAVTGLQARISTLPTYEVTLQNLSAKNVAALGVELHVNGRRRISSLRQGNWGERLIEAGATYTLVVAGADNAQLTHAGYQPESPPNQEILIKTIVFSDGSYEGDAEIAASFRAFQAGRKSQIARLVEVLQTITASTEAIDGAAAEKLKAQVASLNDEAETAVLKNLRREFPGFNQDQNERVKASVEVSQSAIKTDFLKELRAFEKGGKRAADADAFRAWLSASKQKYAQWLARL